MFLYAGWSFQQAVRSLWHLMLEPEVSHLVKKVSVTIRCEIYDVHVTYMTSMYLSFMCAETLEWQILEPHLKQITDLVRITFYNQIIQCTVLKWLVDQIKLAKNSLNLLFSELFKTFFLFSDLLSSLEQLRV